MFIVVHTSKSWQASPLSDVNMAGKKKSQKQYSHLVQLFIDFLVVLIVFTKLGDQRSICQSKQLRVLQRKGTEVTLFMLFKMKL